MFTSVTDPASSRSIGARDLQGLKRRLLSPSDAALAVAGAAAMTLAAPPTNLWCFGLFVWVPLAIVAMSGSTLRAGLVGWIQGTLTQGAVLLPVCPQH